MRGKVEKTMKAEIIRKSICSTCNEMEKCFSNRSVTEPVFFCEEFNNSVHAQNKSIKNDEESVKENTDNKTGLCINCDNKENCTIRNDNAVIWHCEEYL